jgi:hypothetical protein
MSPNANRIAFLNSANEIVQIIVGDLDESTLGLFLDDYGILFGATDAVRIYDDRFLDLRWNYEAESGDFAEPTTPAPLPEPAPEPDLDPEIAAIVERLEVIEADLGIPTKALEAE